MNGLIKIDVNENYEQVTSARELHVKLGIQRHFSQWWEYQVEKLNLEPEQDFLTILLESTGGRPSTDYVVSLDIAKHICMMSGGEMAWKIRDYFIQVEKAWNSPEQIMARALQISNRMILSLQKQYEELLPKGQAYDLFIDGKNAQSMNVVAKSLGTGRTRLFQFLRDKGILMANNTPYQEYLYRGYFRVVEKPIVMGDKAINKPQTFVTAKGVDFIAKLKREEVPYDDPREHFARPRPGVGD